jgi:hypothetical protein
MRGMLGLPGGEGQEIEVYRVEGVFGEAPIATFPEA